jgi:hypothetical protein
VKRRDKIVFGAIGALTVVVLAAGALLVVLPQRSQAHKVDDQIAQAQAQYVAMHRSGAHSAPSVDATAVYDLTRAMPDTDDMPDALVELSRLARTTKSTLVSVKPSAATSLPNGSSALPIQLTLEGSWTAVTGFLAGLRNEMEYRGGTYHVHGRLFEIDSVQLTPQGDGLQALLGIDAFDYGTPPPAGTSPTTTGTTTTTSTTTTPSAGTQQAAGLPGEGS